jgi:hypothetical protein
LVPAPVIVHGTPETGVVKGDDLETFTVRDALETPLLEDVKPSSIIINHHQTERQTCVQDEIRNPTVFLTPVIE